MMAGVGEGVGVGVAEGAGEGVGIGDGVGTGAGVGVGDADGEGVGVGVAVGVGLEGTLFPLVLAALDELPPPQPTAPNNMLPRTATARYLNIPPPCLELGKVRCSRVPAGCLLRRDRLAASSYCNRIWAAKQVQGPGVHRPMHHFPTHPWLLTDCIALGL